LLIPTTVGVNSGYGLCDGMAIGRSADIEHWLGACPREDKIAIDVELWGSAGPKTKELERSEAKVR
jgi:hypothetical protein